MYVVYFSTLEKWPSGGDICIPEVHSLVIIQILGASWSQDSIWPVFVDSVWKLQDHSFLISGGYSLMGEVALEVCEDFLMGGTSACPLVDGAGSWLSGGQNRLYLCT